MSAPEPRPDVPLAEQIWCVRREINMRERVYPRWVLARRMSQHQADRELAAMRAVLATLLELEQLAGFVPMDQRLPPLLRRQAD